MRWMHIVVGTLGSWLHGDPRGFRDRDHRLHSTGDYKNPPPSGEHAGVHRHYERCSRDPVDLDVEARVIICRAFVMKWRAMGHRVIACSVGKRHLHAIVEGPEDHQLFDKEVGRAKQASSCAVRATLPGKIWAANGGYKPIRGKGHLRNSYMYIRTRQEAGTVVWSHREDENWIDGPSIGVIVMRGKKDPIRLCKPASEGTPEGPDR